MPWSVVGIELMLQKNAIKGELSLTSTGQVIPLVIGMASVVKLAFNAFTDGFEVPPLMWGFFVCCSITICRFD